MPIVTSFYDKIFFSQTMLLQCEVLGEVYRSGEGVIWRASNSSTGKYFCLKGHFHGFVHARIRIVSF